MPRTAEFEARLEEVRRNKRSHVRWAISSHTAELAIRAIEGHVRIVYRPGSKSRRRRKHKRML